MSYREHFLKPQFLTKYKKLCYGYFLSSLRMTASRYKMFKKIQRKTEKTLWNFWDMSDCDPWPFPCPETHLIRLGTGWGSSFAWFNKCLLRNLFQLPVGWLGMNSVCIMLPVSEIWFFFVHLRIPFSIYSLRISGFEGFVLPICIY